MATPLLQLKDVTVAFGGRPVLDGVEFHLAAGERLCLVGRNGAGKSTLLSVIAGTLEPDGGEVIQKPGLVVGTLPQAVPTEGISGTVYDVVRAGLGSAAGGPDERRHVERSISRVGLEPDAPFAELSAGRARRALLARAVVADPDVLLLDEPTNHLDLASIAWVEDLLLRRKTTLIFVTHDRAFLRKVATGILDLDRGVLNRWPGDYDRYRERKDADLSTEGRRDSLFDKELAREEAWIRQGVRERRKRNQGRVRRLLDMRGDRAGRRERAGKVKIAVQDAERTGRLVLKTKDVSFAYDGTPVLKDLNLSVLRGDRLGIVGPNGSGKTTLLRVLLGDLPPDTGDVRHGTNLQIAYFDQLHAQLDDHATAADNVSGGRPTVTVNGKARGIVGYLHDFLFTPDQARSLIKDFSGGERNRLLLARLFASPSNVLVLDEPTNDLDLETLEVLEDLLGEYEGTILLVSHDRELLDDVVTSTLVLEPGGTAREHVGGWSDRPRTEEETAKPKKKDTRPRKEKRRSPLSRDEKKELAKLPARIEALEAEQAALHETMADPAFFKQAGDKIVEAQSRLQTLEGDLAGTYERWERLEAKQASAEP